MLKQTLLAVAAVLTAQLDPADSTPEPPATINYGAVTIEATREQALKYSKIQADHDDRVTPLERQREQLDADIRSAESERERAVWDLLTAAQRETVLGRERRSRAQRVHEEARFLSLFATFAPLAADMHELSVYPGVPRGDGGTGPTESKTAIEKSGYSFEDAPLPLAPEARRRLEKTFSDYRRFEPYAGPKLCGDFHPDLCLEWQADDVPVRVLICLSCGEALVILDETRFKMDLGDGLGRELRQLGDEWRPEGDAASGSPLKRAFGR